jgi:F0F1-type ATP synthase membrane subunit b/b'
MYERQKDIQTCMTHGKTRAETCRELAEKWKVSIRSMERQYDDMVQSLEKEVEAGRAELRAKLMARNDEIYKKSMAEAKYKTALDANIAQAKIGGLMVERQVEGDKVPQLITITEREYTSPTLVKTGSDNE